MKIYLSPPWTGDEEREAVSSAFDSGYVAPCGPFTDRFEEELCRLSGRKYAVAVSGGTAAIDLLMDHFNVDSSATVVVPTLTFIATAGPARHRGAKIAFVDCDATGNADPASLGKVLSSTPGRKVFIGVDLYGRMMDYSAIEEICARHDTLFICDSAEAVGASRGGRPAGSGGAAGIYSFNGNKIITTSGGGAVVTDDEELARHVRKLSTQARENAVWYEHRELGYNYRLSNLLSAVGLAQLGKLAGILEKRCRNRERYERIFSGIPGEFLPAVEGENHWLTVRIFESAAERDALVAAFSAAGVETRPVWKPLHLQPVFAGIAGGPFPVSEFLFARGLCLPSGTGLDEKDFSLIESVVGGFYDHRRT